ncbi:MAG: tetratricopeptide repeat protein [Pirellulales bacterium]|nr:tetratricopeptide repeat protein [Pirellulales bacterium]
MMATIGVTRDSSAESPLPSPKQLWERCRQSLPPFTYDVVSDEVVTSDTDPRLKLRRMKIRFISQEINGMKMGHDAVIFLPAEPGMNSSPERRGKVVVVARNYSDDTLVGNCAEPIAARTGYPTMCIVVPGDQDGNDGEMPWLTGLRKLAHDTQDPVNHDLFRCAIPYLRALDVFSDVLKQKNVRAVIGGHSKRAYYAYTAAAIDPERIAGVVYMGCERLFSEDEKYPDFSVSPPFAPGEKYPRSLVLFTTQKYVKCPVLYLGATNEAGFSMFNINELAARMTKPWTIEYIPNYRHASRSEKQFIDWQMWVAHIFDGRPLATVGDLRVERTGNGTRLGASVKSPNKILQVKAWYVYCDDVPYWRDLMWYPALMRKKHGNQYEAWVGGNPPDAWFVEVKDIGHGFPGFVSSLPQNLTGKPAAERNARRPRNWERRHKNSAVAGEDQGLPGRLSAPDRYAAKARSCSKTRYRYGEAMDAYRAWLRLAPEDVDAHNGLGRLYYDLEQWDKAASEFQFVIQSGDGRPQAYLNLVRTYMNPGRYDQAEETLKACLKRFGDRTDVYLALALIHQYRGEYRLAREVVDKAIALDPNVAACHASKGDVYLYSGNLDRAEAQYQKLFEDPRPEFHRLGLYRLSELRLLQGRFNEARDLAQQGYDLARKRKNKGTMRDRLSLLAHLDALAGHPQEAIARLDTLWKTTLVDEELEWQRFIVYSKGLVYARTGQLDEALREAKKLEDLTAKGLDKKKTRLFLHLMGVIEIERKDYSKAVEYLEQSLPMICLRSRLNIAVADSLASAYVGTGQLKKARKEYERMATFPRGRQFYGHLYALSFYRLGSCWEAEGRTDEAKKYYQKFLNLWHDADPGIPEMRQASKKLKQWTSR